MTSGTFELPLSQGRSAGIEKSSGREHDMAEFFSKQMPSWTGFAPERWGLRVWGSWVTIEATGTGCAPLGVSACTILKIGQR